MKGVLILTLIVFFTSTSYSCDCECMNDCSFHKIFMSSKFVALVKVISYDNYLGREIMGYNKNMPQSMEVEIIRLYKGFETRKKIRIWGDNGMLCRPYIANFAIGDYFLIAPRFIKVPSSLKESTVDYEFFSCVTDYLRVDKRLKVAYGEYKEKQNKILLRSFEKIINRMKEATK